MFFKFVGLLPERIFKKGRPARSCTVLLAKGLFFTKMCSMCADGFVRFAKYVLWCNVHQPKFPLRMIETISLCSRTSTTPEGLKTFMTTVVISD